MFGARTDLMISMIIVGLMFLTVIWVAFVIYALDGMDGKTDSNAGLHMIWVTALFVFIEYSMLNVMPVKATTPSAPEVEKK